MAKKKKSVFQSDVNKGRLEFLFDGLFAIAMTILVIEIKLPGLQDPDSMSELAQALKHHRWTFFSYVLSFVILGGFWISHNRLYARLRRISSAALGVHIALMAAAAFFPFCAHLYGAYTKNKLAALVYFTVIVVFYLGLAGLTAVAQKQKLFDEDVPVGDIRRLRRSFLANSACLVAAYLLIYTVELFG